MGDIRKIVFEENKLEKKLCRLVGQAIGDFGMIEDGDKVRSEEHTSELQSH